MRARMNSALPVMVLALLCVLSAGVDGEENAPRGTIVSSVAGMMDTYEVSLTREQGIEVGDIVDVTRGGKKIASGIVISAGSQSSRIVLKGTPPPCSAGDEVIFVSHRRVPQNQAATPSSAAPSGSSSATFAPTVEVELGYWDGTESQLKAGEPNHVSFVYSYKGKKKTVEGYVIFPSSSRSPAILFAQGAGATAEGEASTLEYLKNKGYAAMSVDYGGNIFDLIAALLFLQRRPFVDQERMALIGYSLGGRAVVAVTEYTRGLRAVVEISGRFLVDGTIITNESQSPLAYAQLISCPVFILHGENDETVPKDNAIALGEKLKELGKPFDIRICKGEGHEYRNWSQVLEESLRFLSQFI